MSSASLQQAHSSFLPSRARPESCEMTRLSVDRLREHEANTAISITGGVRVSEIEPRLLPKSGQPAPVTLEAYRRQGGYQALERGLKELTPELILGEIRQARLRGRGGAGVMTAEKMALVGRSAEDQKYIVCNAYDADPRARISSTLLSQNPHLVVEGIALAAYTVGASEAFLYLRGADKALVAGLERVLEEATTAGVLGRSVLGTPFALSITLVGADMGFMGGEESTLLQIIKGRPPKAQQRPPYPTQYGIGDRPTLIANVETIANLPIIMTMGGEAYSRTGTSTSSGTKLFTVIGPAGAAETVVEVRIGASIEEALRAANVTATAATARAVVVGGLEGGALPLSLLNTPLDFESVEDTGA